MITSFSGENRFLSNFWPAKVMFGPYMYPTVEHAFVAGKTLDEGKRKIIRDEPSPGKVKRYGKKLVLVENWEEEKYDFMYKLVFQKFNSHQDLKQKLFDTGDQELIEGNAWGDKYWGCVWQENWWTGENNLGKILMDVRKTLKEI